MWFIGNCDNMSAIRCLIPRISPKNTALMVCDMQEKFRGNIVHYNEIIAVAKRLVQASGHLDMKIVATEQYPKGLGHTVAELEMPKDVPILAKKKFSMCVPSVMEHLGTPECVVLCGIEGHVCVLHTALDLLEKGIGVHVVADAVSSRASTDRMFGLRQMEKAGAVLTTSENVILGLLGGADHPKFKEVQKIIMNSAPDTGLLNLMKL